MTQQTYREVDEDRIPSGWSGGEAVPTGDGVHTRTFVNTDRMLRITYDIPDANPVVEQIEKPPAVIDPDYRVEGYAGTATNDDWRRVCDTDAEALEACYELMEEIEARDLTDPETDQ